MAVRKITQHRLPLDFDGETKTCKECQEPKPLSEFHKRSAEPDGLNRRCKPCARARLNKYRKANPEATRKLYNKEYDRIRRVDPDYRYRREYGMERGEYDALVEKQGGKCGICGVTENLNRNRWCVDHDHSTGKVRGLLCVKCNTGIGNLGDTLEAVERAVKYLKESSDG